jgi:HD domain
VEIAAEQFEALWPLTAGRRLSKLRHYVPTEAREIEVDVYGGALEGLIIAEIEFGPGEQPELFEPPEWLGDDVTGQPRYANQSLATRGIPTATTTTECRERDGPRSTSFAVMLAVPTPDAKLSFIQRLPLTRAAVEFARERHSGQRRRGDHATFVVHPLEVASLLERSHYPDHVVAAAVLHDVLEDTDVDRGELEGRFGPEVAQLVSIVSDDPSVRDEEARKDQVRERVRGAGGYAAAIYGADKVSKVRELRMLLVVGISDEEAGIRLERYSRSLRMLEEAIPGSRLVELLRFELEALERLPPEDQP